MSPIAVAVPLNAQYDGTSTIEPSRQVATPMITATHGPARIAASVMPIESRKTGSLIDCAIQATTKLRPTSVGMRASLEGFNDRELGSGNWELGIGITWRPQTSAATRYTVAAIDSLSPQLPVHSPEIPVPSSHVRHFDNPYLGYG